jgi:hypothetical protein
MFAIGAACVVGTVALSGAVIGPAAAVEIPKRLEAPAPAASESTVEEPAAPPVIARGFHISPPAPVASQLRQSEPQEPPLQTVPLPASKRVRVLDELAVVHRSRGAVDWRTAARLCQSLRVEGRGGFHLPSMSVLRRLRWARFLRAGSYWSRTLAAPGRNYVLHTHDGASVWDKSEAGAFVVCVQSL